MISSTPTAALWRCTMHGTASCVECISTNRALPPAPPPPEWVPPMDLARPLPAGFVWCDACQASREGWHVHGDHLETLDRGELLEMVRGHRRAVNGSAAPAGEAGEVIG